jgi:hypothetical protein
MKSTQGIAQGARQMLSRGLVLGPLAFLVVAGTGCPGLFQGPEKRATTIRQALVGRDGARTISAANTVVNAYAALNTSASAGDTTITVANINALDTGFSAALSQGDLLLIIQMAGATINATDTPAYGTVTALGSAGRYEFAGVEAVSGTQITLACGLKNSYSGAAGNAQVIRVPQYTTLTIASGASITAPAWNGTTGGVVAVHAETTLRLDGQIDVSAKGFRGGATSAGKTSAAAGTGVVVYRSTMINNGAEKGEGIAGYGFDYAPFNGRYGRGAPANAGGGGNSHNAGGGGGANARSGSAWNGQGVMLSSVTGGATAWPLDPGYALTTPSALTDSEGGGRGGYSYSVLAADPLTTGPGDSAWGGDDRREVGGLGGHPLDNDPGSRLFMGGGGGAGDGNDDAAGRGGNGGGLVFIIAGSVAGAGSILADGEAGANSNGDPGDAPGGGGGGGTVVVHAGDLSAITISADGGRGGNHLNSSGDNEVEGPGGGGGGGYIAVSGGAPITSAQGGLGGTTNRAVMASFPSDGATAGNAGQTNGNASVFVYCGTVLAPDTSITSQPTNPSPGNTGSFTFEATQDVPGSDGGVVAITGSVSFECNLDGAAWTPCPASYTTPALGDGPHTLSVRATDLSGNTDATPAVYGWTVQAGALDAGVLDAGIDAGLSPDVAPMDLAGGRDGLTIADTASVFIDMGGKADVVARDGADKDDAALPGPDTTPVLGVDADTDTTVAEAGAGAGIDGLPFSLDGGAVDSASDAVPIATDASAVPEPVADAAPLVGKDAASPTGTPDAAPTDDTLRLMGGGFCNMVAPGTTVRTHSSTVVTAWMLLGLALVLRRRRR